MFYWVGTSQKQGSALTSTDIRLYSSENLVEWQNRGSIFNWRSLVGFPSILPYGHLYQPPPPFRIERPKV